MQISEQDPLSVDCGAQLVLSTMDNDATVAVECQLPVLEF